jgi:Fic family protein
LFSKPIINVQEAQELLKVTAPTANALLQDFVRLKILKERTGYQRNRVFSFVAYLRLFE